MKFIKKLFLKFQLWALNQYIEDLRAVLRCDLSEPERDSAENRLFLASYEAGTLSSLIASL